jgi:hypothetical protein
MSKKKVIDKEELEEAMFECFDDIFISDYIDEVQPPTKFCGSEWEESQQK